jgi:hypothetical protein
MGADGGKGTFAPLAHRVSGAHDGSAELPSLRGVEPLGDLPVCVLIEALALGSLVLGAVALGDELAAGGVCTGT